MVGWYPGDREKVTIGNGNIFTKTLCLCCHYLYACMAAQVEVKLKGMSDAGIHCSPCRNIPTLPNLSKENTR